MKIETRQLLADYGQDVWTAAGAAAHMGIIRRGPMSPRAYVGITRRILNRQGLESLAAADGRLIVCGFDHAPPSEWAGRTETSSRGGSSRRLADWLAYWRETQARPETVGSIFNDLPGNAYAAWTLGIPTSAYPRGWAYLFNTGRGLAGPRRIKAILRLARILDRPTWAASTQDLSRMARMRPAFLRWATAQGQWGGLPTIWTVPDGPKNATARLDWDGIAELARQWPAVVRHETAWTALRLPAAEWTDTAPAAVRGELRGELIAELSDANVWRLALGLAASPVAVPSGLDVVALSGLLCEARLDALALRLRLDAPRLTWQRHCQVATRDHDTARDLLDQQVIAGMDRECLQEACSSVSCQPPRWVVRSAVEHYRRITSPTRALWVLHASTELILRTVADHGAEAEAEIAQERLERLDRSSVRALDGARYVEPPTSVYEPRALELDGAAHGPWLPRRAEWRALELDERTLDSAPITGLTGGRCAVLEMDGAAVVGTARAEWLAMQASEATACHRPAPHRRTPEPHWAAGITQADQVQARADNARCLAPAPHPRVATRRPVIRPATRWDAMEMD